MRVAPPVAENPAQSTNTLNPNRRHFLRHLAATALLAPTLVEQLASPALAEGSNTNTKVTGSVYKELSAADRIKFIQYTEMLQKMWMQDMRLLLKLHPEYALDYSPKQQSIFAQGKSFEFSQGYVYHGRNNLSDVLLGTKLPKNSFVTRVPQTWALQPFVDLETDPAIYVIDAIDFNRAQNQGKADLKIDAGGTDERGLHHYEPYPLFTEEFPISSIQQIITTKETYEKYKSLIERHDKSPSKLSERDKQLVKAVKPLMDNGKLVFLETSSSWLNTFSTEAATKRFLRLNADLEKHMQKFGLDQQIPMFRIRTGSLPDNEYSPKLPTIKEARERDARKQSEQEYSAKNNGSNKGRNIFIILFALIGAGYYWDTSRPNKPKSPLRK